jgi:hypothetical protein
MRNVLYIFTIIYVSIGCGRSITQPLEVIDLSIPPYAKTVISLSQIADSVEIVFLETNELSLVGNIWDIEVTNNHILIVDQSLHKALLFLRNGKFVNQIGTKGLGPNEYIQIIDCCFSETGDEIFALCNASKRIVYVYDLEGHFKRSINCDNLPSLIASFNSNLLFHHGLPSSHYANDGYSLNILDDNLELHRLLKRENKTQGMPLGLHLKQFTIIDDNMSIWELYYDTVYYCDKNLEIKPRFVIKHKDNYIYANGILPPNEESMRFANSEVMGDLFDTEDFVFINSVVKRRTENIIYIKDQKRIFQIDGNNIINDIAGPNKIWPFKALGNNLICSQYQIMDLKAEKNDSDNMNRLNPTKHKRYLEHIDKLSDYDNQCLLLIDLKYKNHIGK